MAAPRSSSKNAHYDANFIDWIAMNQVQDRPLTITEWNAQYPSADRFTAPMWLASIASLQGWDATMIYNYSQVAMVARTRNGPVVDLL